MGQVVDLPLDLLQPLIQLRSDLCKTWVPPLKSTQVLPQLLAVDAEPTVVIRQPDPGILLDAPVRLVVRTAPDGRRPLQPERDLVALVKRVDEEGLDDAVDAEEVEVVDVPVEAALGAP
jgi:hypothetical protein